MRRSIHGITFIELVLVLVIFGVLGVMTIPEYLDASAQAVIQAKWDKSGEVKALHHEISEQRNDFPSVAVLAAHLPGERVAARGDGIMLQVGDENYLIPTYKNTLCTELTQSTEDPVGCVGTIPS